MEPAIRIVTLGMDDLDRSARFYRDGLGLPLQGEGARLSPCQVPDNPMKTGPWIGTRSATPGSPPKEGHSLLPRVQGNPYR